MIKKNYLVLTLLLTFLMCFPAYAQHLYRQNPLNNKILTDNKLHIYFCGTGVPQPDMKDVRKPSCLAVIGHQQFLLFDAGENATSTLSGMGLPYLELENIFLSHLHSDHISGLGSVMNETWYEGRAKPITVYGPYGTATIIDGLKKFYSFDIIYRSIGAAGKLNPDLAIANGIEFYADKKGKTLFDKNNIKITAFPVEHLPVFPAYGYRINYKGCKIVVSG